MKSRVICKSQNGESGNRKSGMMGTWGIWVELWGIKVGLWGNQGGNAGYHGGNAGNQGENAGNRGGNVGNVENQDGNVGNQDRNAGNRGGNAGNQGGNARNQWGMGEIRVGMQGMGGGNTGNQGGNAGNQGDYLWESLCLFFRLKSCSVRGPFHLPTFMGSCPTISHTFFVLSTKWMRSRSRKWGRGISPRFHILVFAWCESGKLGRGRRSSRFFCVTPVVRTSSDRVTFRILSNINDWAPLQKQPTALHVDCFHKKARLHTYDRIQNADLTGGAVNMGCEWTTGPWNS